jgi:mannosyltransferase
MIAGSRVDWRPWLAAAVALALGLFRLELQPIWLDEFVTVSVATAADERFWARVLGDQSFSGLYYLLMRGWAALGTDPFIIRLPSVIFAALAVIAVYHAARLLLGRTDAALLAALLTATNAFVIRYAQEARAYSLALLLATLAMLAGLWALERSSARRWAGHALLATAAAYAHVFVLLVSGWLAMVTAARRRLDRPALLSFVLVGLLVAPLIAATVSFGPPREWIEEPTLRIVPRLANLLAGGIPAAGTLPVQLFAFGAAAMVGLVAGLREPERWRYGLLLGWLVVPPLATFAGSLLLQPMMVARYYLICVPPLMMLAASGVCRLRPAWLRLLGALALLAVAAYGLAWLYFEFQKPAFIPAV